MFNSLYYERERKRHERSFENFIKSTNTFALHYLFIYSRGERASSRRRKRKRRRSCLSFLFFSQARERESVFDLSLVSSHLGKDSVVVVSLVCVVKGREDTNHIYPRVLKERDRTERHRAGE